MLSALVAILRSPAHSRTPVVDGQAARRSHHIHNGYYSNKNASTPPRGQRRVVIQKLYMITQNNFPYKICMAKSATHFHLFHSRIRFLHLFLAFLLLKRTTVYHMILTLQCLPPISWFSQCQFRSTFSPSLLSSSPHVVAEQPKAKKPTQMQQLSVTMQRRSDAINLYLIIANF